MNKEEEVSMPRCVETGVDPETGKRRHCQYKANKSEENGKRHRKKQDRYNFRCTACGNWSKGFCFTRCNLCQAWLNTNTMKKHMRKKHSNAQHRPQHNLPPSPSTIAEVVVSPDLSQDEARPLRDEAVPSDEDSLQEFIVNNLDFYDIVDKTNGSVDNSGT